MHTELYCANLSALDPIKAIRAIHQAWLQLAALNTNVDCESFDNAPALASLAQCLVDAGHAGFNDTPERRAYLGELQTKES